MVPGCNALHCWGGGRWDGNDRALDHGRTYPNTVQDLARKFRYGWAYTYRNSACCAPLGLARSNYRLARLSSDRSYPSVASYLGCGGNP
jgi:hypothetical protein